MVVLEKGQAPSYVRSPVRRFLASLPVDRQLARYDIAGSIAHVEMLRSVGLLTEEEEGALSLGLRRIWGEMRDGAFPWREDLEDVHTNVEVRLTELLGPIGAKVHTARSRNDQVALDERLFLREAGYTVEEHVFRLQLALLDQAERHLETLLPGYTHLQRAQPITLGHHLLAHFWRLARDMERLAGCLQRANVSPLGAGALAGSTLPINPTYVAQRLGFHSPFENSLDAVSDRDYFVEFLFDLSLLAAHLSSIGAELVLWSTSEFGFVRPSAELGSGSSLMPQKRNPDVAELARGRAARVLGDLVSVLATLKSLPLAYNRDLQEDKAPVFDATRHVVETLESFALAIPALDFDVDRMAAAATDERLLATDLAEFLASKGVPFREAHERVAEIFASNETIDVEVLKAAHPKFEGAGTLLDIRKAVARRRTPGGPAPETVLEQLAKARDIVGLEQYALSKHAESVQLIDSILEASK